MPRIFYLILGTILVLATAPGNLIGALEGAPRPNSVDSAAPVQEVEQVIVEEVTRSVGLVRSAGGVGTGWVVRAGMVATNLHVAKAGSGDIYVDFDDGERVECYTAVTTRDMDLAILRCETGTRRPLPIDIAVPPQGETVAVVGYPGGAGPIDTYGEITGKRNEVRGIPTIQYTAETEPGSSGSPVFDTDGEVRGVVTFSGGHGVPIGELVPLLDIAEGFPATKEGAEWRLRGRRVGLAIVVVLPLRFLWVRRSGRNQPVISAIKWSIFAVIAALAWTQIQFGFSGPAHFI